MYLKGFSYSVDSNIGVTNGRCKTLLNILDSYNHLKPKLLEEREEELEWFLGFSSRFFISKLGALFKIKLHWDDRQTLVYRFAPKTYRVN